MVRPLDPRMLRYARASRGYVVLTAGLGLATALLVVAQALLLARVIAAVAMDGAQPDTVLPQLAWIAGIVAARAVVAGLQDRYAHRAATAVIAQLRQAVLHRVADDVRAGTGPEHAERAPHAQHARRAADPAALTTVVTRGLDGLDGYLTKYLPQLLLAATVTPAVLAVIWTRDLIAALTVTITLPLVPVFMALVGWSTAAAAGRRLASMQRLGAQLLDLVAGLPTLRALGRQRGQAIRVREVGDAYRRATMGTLRQAFLSALVLETLTTLSVALVAVGIGLRLVFGGLDLETGLAVLILAPEVYLPLRMVGVHYHASVDGLAAAGAAFEVLDAPHSAPGTDPAPDLRTATIRLRGVSVLRRGRPAPDALDLDLQPGEVVALVGPNGAGKSTALDVLLGLRRPDAGAVTVQPDDAAHTDLARLDPGSWHRQLAWVPQQPALVPGTIEDNVWLGAERSGRVPERLRTASAATGLDDVVAGLPHGWQTRLGAGGHGLSAGQRQRIGLTRALLHADAALVLLDEPTAHLDADAEQVVPAVLADWRRRGTTVLLVTHRPALAALADRQVSVTSTVATPTNEANEATGATGAEPAS